MAAWARREITKKGEGGDFSRGEREKNKKWELKGHKQV